MPAPFYNAIKGTTSGTPGTGAFTPNAASTGYRAWSTVPSGWVGLVRFEDGTAWELAWSYWNGTTLSRASTQMYDSSSGSHLTLTSSATAAMVIEAGEIMSHLGDTPWRGWFANVGTSAAQAVSLPSPTATGTAAAGSYNALTSAITQQTRVELTSSTTASAQSGWSNAVGQMLVSTSAGAGGWEMTTRFGCTALPTGPRLFVGTSSVTMVAKTVDPSAVAAHVAAFAKDAADTNIQLLTNAGTATGTKIDTGMPLVAGGWYEACVWMDPGSNKVFGLLIRLDTGAIWFGSTTTNVPASGTFVFPQIVGGLNGTNTGTAMVLAIGSMVLRGGF